MKILYLITKSNWGGAQKYVFDLALAMKNEGHDISVASGGSGILKEKLEQNNIKFIEIKNLERDINIFKDINVFINIYKLLKKENPDLIHVNSSKIGGVASFIGRLAKIKKIIYTAHGFPFREERSWWQILLIKFLSWITILLSHKTICVSKKDFNDVFNWLFVSNKIITIHNGIEIKKIENNKEKNENDLIKIVSIGELHKNKGFIFAIDIIKILKEKKLNFHYTILSFGGEEEKTLKEKIEKENLKDFIFLDINKRNHVNELKDFDIYFMPSIKEGLPYVLLEASLYSLPLIASDTGGIKEIVEHNKNGFLVSKKDIISFSNYIEKLILEKELRKNFGQFARIKIEKEFDIKDMIDKTKKVYFE